MKKVLIDTNIIISSILFPEGKASQALNKCFTDSFVPVLCDYVIDELSRKFYEKFPDMISEFEFFLRQIASVVEIVKTPEEVMAKEDMIRDVKDRPILRAALNSHSDLLLTGDKDFLESSITNPRIISASEFLRL